VGRRRGEGGGRELCVEKDVGGNQGVRIRVRRACRREDEGERAGVGREGGGGGDEKLRW